MFRRQNTWPKQNADGQNINQDIVEGQNLEDNLLKIGNESINDTDDLPNPKSNEANVALNDPSADELVNENKEPGAEDVNPLDLGMIMDAPKSLKKKKKASNKKSKKAEAEDAAAPQTETEDLTQIDKSLEPVEGMNFVVEKLPERKKRIRDKTPELVILLRR